MFQNKHVIRASFVGLFLAILASIFFYRYYTIRSIVVESVLKQNTYITKYYVNNIWNKYVDSASLLKPRNLSDSVKDKNFKDFANESLKYLKDQRIPKIDIININKEVFLTTRENELVQNTSFNSFEKLNIWFDEYFLGKRSYQDSLKAVFNGETTFNVILGSTLKNPPDGVPRVYIESFIPLINLEADPYAVNGAFRVISNITEEWTKIKYFENRVSIFLLTVFSLFFIVVVFNTQHAQKIIDQQVANNRFLIEAREKAETESSAKTQFLANVSHELRTPLNAIIGFSEVILTEAYGKLEHPQYSEYIQDINNSGKHLLSVINDILDFSKASADKLKVDMIEVDVTKLASSSLRFVKPRADEAKINLIEKLPKDHIVIKADPKRLKQALLNLLSNSVKFTPENGSVTLEIDKNSQENKVYIKVTDTGIGMEEKDIPKALTSFGQIDNKLSRKYEGTGLGLPLTKKLVELMNGKFEIKSKSGAGTTVTISFKYEDF